MDFDPIVCKLPFINYKITMTMMNEKNGFMKAKLQGSINPSYKDGEG